MAQGERTNPFVVSSDFIESLDSVGPVEPGAGEIIRRFLEHEVHLEQSPLRERVRVLTPLQRADKGRDRIGITLAPCLSEGALRPRLS